MDTTLKLAIDWLIRDETGEEGEALHDVIDKRLYEVGTLQWLEKDFWLPMLCNVLPVGVDYYLFDLAYRFSPKVAGRLVLNIKGKFSVLNYFSTLSIDGKVEAIEKLDFISRSNLKSSLAWQDNKHRLTNRANRAKKRALDLIEGRV